MSSVSPSPIASPTPEPAEEELYSAWALFILVALLIGALWTSYYLQLRKITAIHETVVSIVAGMVAGFIIRVSPGSIIQGMVTFNHSYFFNLLLPPIILNSGYELRKLHFFNNFGAILTFAFVGTVISTFVIGILIWLIGLTGLEGVSLSLLDSLIFGSVLSSTDPVTVLAIFSQLKVDPKLYAVIFGESMLNDAVAIVLFGTFQNFRGEELHIRNLVSGVGYFLSLFFGSLVIGVITGALVALVLKHSQLRKFAAIESCLVALVSYSTYFFSNGCQMSGIVSLLFCGISLKHYAYENMSLRTRRTTKYMFKVLAQLSENFIFIYLGITLFTKSDEVFKPFMIILTVIIMTTARYCSVFPLAKLINFFAVKVLRRHQDTLTRSHQIMLFWAGLRGAVAFALAYNIKSSDGPWLQTTILCVVVVSIIGLGGTTSRILKRLGVRTGVVEDGDESDEDGDEQANHPNDSEWEGRHRFSLESNGPENPRPAVHIDWGHNEGSSRSDADARNGGTSSPDRSNSPARIEIRTHTTSGDEPNAGDEVPIDRRPTRRQSVQYEGSNSWFLAFDNRYIKPFLSATYPARPRPDDDDRSRRPSRVTSTKGFSGRDEYPPARNTTENSAPRPSAESWRDGRGSPRRKPSPQPPTLTEGSSAQDNGGRKKTPQPGKPQLSPLVDV